ncbi:MAG: NAD(P)H-hydrate dehydratase [Muribaculaceae bacterium]|nr:NAD(P)H-hydrate dehydratase [Muribaculaceae bacterium]
MKIFSSKQIRQITQAAINSGAITLDKIIDRMADEAFYQIASRFNENKRVVVFSGAETAGAYSIATAIKLLGHGYPVEVAVFDIYHKMTAECKVQLNRLSELIPDGFTLITGQTTFEPPKLTKNDVVIDGLFGADLTRPLLGGSGFPMLINYINESKAFTVSFDVPSGMMSEWNRDSLLKNMIHSNVTVAAHYPRLAYFIPDCAPAVGAWIPVDLEISDEITNTTVTDFHYIEAADIRRLLRHRDPFANKSNFGSALIVAGSYGMIGAAILSARGALRAGAGKVTVHAPLCGHTPMQSAVPEALFDADKNEAFISDMSVKGKFNAIGIGPGIGHNNTTISALENLLLTNSTPMVLDADALNCIAAKPSLLDNIKPMSIITPHTGEFDHIFGTHNTHEARLIKAVEMAKRYRIFIVLKGHYTATIRPDGKVMFNTSGNAGMATGGSGDVLTGIITGLIAQGYKPERAALIGVYVHGLAGDMAAEQVGEYAVTASDIAANVGRAISDILNSSK